MNIKKLNKKKKIIIGMTIISILVSAPIIPIIIVGSNNDKKNKEDVAAVIKLLTKKSIPERTLEISSDSSGKIIANNKKKIIKKVKKLIGTSRLREVSIDVSVIADTYISRIGQAIIVTIKKDKYSRELKGKSGFKVMRSKNIEEIKIHTIKTYLKSEGNLNLVLPKNINFTYNNDIKILIAIKKKLLDTIEGVAFNIDGSLIVKKEGVDEVNEIAIDGEEATLYEIVVGGEKFILKLNQEKYTDAEKTKIAIIKTYLENLNNLNLVLPKTVIANYNTDAKVLAAIKVKLATISEIGNFGANLITKKEGEGEVTAVANYGEAATEYKITINGQDFSLKINQDEFTKEEKRKIMTIKTYLGIEDNLKIVLPKTVIANYNTDAKVLAAIKVKLATISEIGNFGANLIVKKEGVDEVNEIAIDGEEATLYEIVVGGEKFILKLNQEKYTNAEKTKIAIIKTYLENLNNLNLVLPKTVIANYNTDAKVLAAIKVKLVAAISEINNADFDNLITKKIDENNVTSVAIHNEKSTPYMITISEINFTLNLNQDEYIKTEKDKIKIIQLYLENTNNLNLVLPKDTGSDYDVDVKILISIRTKLIQLIDDMEIDNAYLIVKKENTNNVKEIAVNDAKLATSYAIIVGEKEFILKLNQATSYIKEETKIAAIKKYLNTNSNLMLPKDTGSDYDTNEKILTIIKKKLLNSIKEIVAGVDDGLITWKKGITNVKKIAIHSSTATPYEIVVDEKEFILKLNQDEFTEDEKSKIKIIKMHLKNTINLKLLLPKATNFDYDTDEKILVFIKKKLLDKIKGVIASKDNNLITRKKGATDVKKIAMHGKGATIYEITVGGENFILKLNQKKYTNAEKIKIKIIKTYLNTNLNLVLPKTASFTYNTDEKILAFIKKKLLDTIKGTTNKDNNLIIRKKGVDDVTLVAKHNEKSTIYEITVGKENFILKLNQDEYTNAEKTKINAIKTYLESQNNLNLVLPKATIFAYNTDVKILIAIRKKLVNNIFNIQSSDASLITKKEGTNDVTSIATHGGEATLYIIIVGEKDFTLKLNQKKDIKNEKIKIKTIQSHLRGGFEGGFGRMILLPKDKTGSDYNTDEKILIAIKLKLASNIDEPIIKSNDIDLLITKKVGEDEVTSVASIANHGEVATPYKITIGKKDFILQLAQHM